MADSNSRERLREQLKIHEGFKAFPYRDTVGKLTIGYGRNLDDVGISRDEAGLLLDNDIRKAEDGLRTRYAWFQHLDPVRQTVLINMAVNLGLVTLGQFRATLKAIADGDYEIAARDMLDSRWSRQVKGRAVELAEIMKTGQWPT